VGNVPNHQPRIPTKKVSMTPQNKNTISDLIIYKFSLLFFVVISEYKYITKS